MFIFVRDGRYVTATNKFWFWISVLAGIAGAAMSFSLMKAAGQIPLGIILTLLFAGCAGYIFLKKPMEINISTSIISEKELPMFQRLGLEDWLKI